MSPALRKYINVKSVLIIAIAGAILYFIVGSNHSTPTEKALPDSNRSYPEHLVLKGQFAGTLDAGINAQGVQHAQPDPQWDACPFKQTSCAIYKLGNDAGTVGGASEWQADIYGFVSRNPIVLRLSLEDTPPQGHHDALPRNVLGSTDGQVLLQSANGSTDNEYTAGYESSSFTINKDQTSGTLSVTLWDGQDQNSDMETIKGTWRCA